MLFSRWHFTRLYTRVFWDLVMCGGKQAKVMEYQSTSQCSYVQFPLFLLLFSFFVFFANRSKLVEMIYVYSRSASRLLFDFCQQFQCMHSSSRNSSWGVPCTSPSADLQFILLVGTFFVRHILACFSIIKQAHLATGNVCLCICLLAHKIPSSAN